MSQLQALGRETTVTAVGGNPVQDPGKLVRFMEICLTWFPLEATLTATLCYVLSSFYNAETHCDFLWFFAICFTDLRILCIFKIKYCHQMK